MIQDVHTRCAQTYHTTHINSNIQQLLTYRLYIISQVQPNIVPEYNTIAKFLLKLNFVVHTSLYCANESAKKAFVPAVMKPAISGKPL